ncbi:MAG: bifunctional metallophosphatase/5'-nucleotidase [Clostridia bacterium]|nr:bifunctional metallophosphatase/5'-nucleotidase [Clostridia bacterium]
MKNRLTIYYTSDIHGYLYADDFCNPGPCRRGLYSMHFPKDGNTLVIDGGDFLQGTPLTDYCAKHGTASPLIGAMNEREYDFLTLGNHDFSYGRKYLADTLNAIRAECLCANIDDARGELPLFPWKIKTMENGLRVGIVGLCTDWVPRWEKPENLKDFSFLPPLERAREAVRQMRAAGADVLIGLYHGGTERDLATGRVLTETDEHIACRLCEELPFDLLLTAHQHAEIPYGRWGKTHIVQVGSNAAKYALITMDETGRFSSELREPETPYVPTGERLETYKALGRYLDTCVGRVTRPFIPGEKADMALHGSVLADLLNAVQKEATGAALSCTGLPNTLRPFGEEVTLRDIMVNYPYANTLVVRLITGEILKKALERSASYFSMGPDGKARVSEEFLVPCERHFNYDYFSGVQYVFDLRRPVGDRVTEMNVNGKTVRPEDTFELVMNSFRSGGAGGFEFYLNCPVIRENRSDFSTLILEYLQRHSPAELPEENNYRCIES